MAAAQRGDRAAYERLLAEIRPFVRAIIRHRLLPPHCVEDVIQNVLLTVHRVRYGYDPSRSFRCWLTVIARRRSIDMARTWRRIGAAEVSNEYAYETFPDPAAARELARIQSRFRLAAAIEGLPKSQREALQLLKLSEMNLAEAAQASGKSIVALKVNVHRAVRTLRISLTEQPARTTPAKGQKAPPKRVPTSSHLEQEPSDAERHHGLSLMRP